MKNDKIYPEILSMVLITQVSEGLKADLQLSEEHTSCAVITATIDDFVFLALDEATKKADVDVTYTGSFYGGNPNSSSKLQGEGIGIFAGKTVASVQAAIDAIYDFYDSRRVYAVSCNDEDSIAYLTYTAASVGTYFAKTMDIPLGCSMAYLVGPPIESILCRRCGRQSIQCEDGQILHAANGNQLQRSDLYRQPVRLHHLL